MEYRNELVRVGMLISLITAAVLIGIVIVYRRPATATASMPAYEEPVHVVADDRGTHLEPARTETNDATDTQDEPPGGDLPPS